MWTKLDDALIDHSKIFAAGERLGKDGPAVALGLYCVGLMWTNKHLTDGFLPLTIVKTFRHVKDPLAVADALSRAGLWDRNGGSGYRIHDFADLNPSAGDVKAKRKKDALRKRREREAEA